MDVKETHLTPPGRAPGSRLSLRMKILALTGATGGLVAVILITTTWMQMGDALRNDLSRRASSVSDGARNSSRAASLASRPACANLFHGQTARQSSQP